MNENNAVNAPTQAGAAPSSPLGDAAQPPAEVFLPANTDFASSSFTRVPRAAALGEVLSPGQELTLAVPAGSRYSAQLVVRAAAQLHALRVHVSAAAPVNAAGVENAVPASVAAPAAPRVRARFVGYVPDLSNPGQEVADQLLESPALPVAAGENQPVWLTVEVPERAGPGLYWVSLRLEADGQEVASYTLAVTVPQLRFRPPAQRPFLLDMWIHPDPVARFLDVEPWSPGHLAALEPYWREQASAGQGVVNLAVVEDPWLVELEGAIAAQTESPYRSTVQWRFDGEQWSFDYTVFDRLVEQARACGVGRRIHAFAPLQFKALDRLYYVNAAGQGVSVPMEITDARYRAAWIAFLRDFKTHLEEKGWFEDTSLAFDEQPAQRMEEAFSFVREADPAWEPKIALAANTLAEADLANYISFNYTFLDQVPQELIERRRRAGEPTLFYTWNEPVKPNTVVQTPPFNARLIGWVVRQRNLDGYLRWSFNSWPADVYTQPAFLYDQGDEYVVYPGPAGPLSSIRWETFKDGLEDAELLDLAAQRLGGEHAAVRQALTQVDAQAPESRENFAALLAHRAALLAALTD
ncbi:MAG: DUF4091 domain-containing protein [Buchananella hordeovulneris]|nr:DUF4091 domain-containing protein [Buchananella hordeovulneris]